jgi:DNA-binding CsgD family transcriptional regulator
VQHADLDQHRDRRRRGRELERRREALGDLDEFLAEVSGRRFERRERDVLTAREREVLRLLSEGRTTAEVASRLYLSEHAVRSRIKGAMAKLGARTREHAVAIAIRDAAL